MKSQHSFSQVPRADIARSSFNLSHGLKTTYDADRLVPVLVADIIPGDTWRVGMNFFQRLATPFHPILDNMYFESFFFFVPYRTIWENFEKFHGAQEDPGDSIDFTIPVLATAMTFSVGDMADYMGLPLNLNTSQSPDISALPFRAYRKIYNEWFRDENLQNSLDYFTTDGPDGASNSGATAIPKKRGKRFDYFTGCLPAPQKGTAVSMPLGTTAPIIPAASGTYGFGVPSFDAADLTNVEIEATITTGILTIGAPSSTQDLEWNDPALAADLTNATAATINDIRLAFQTQRLLERDARSGTRYVETLKAHWGVTSPDFRLQRAEFLGGGSTRVNITPVEQQSAQTTPVGDDHLGQLAAYGTVAGKHSFSKSFVEHGVLIGIINVRADLTYSQGVDRYWTKQTRYDFMYPVLTGIGEQAVLNEEIWNTSSAPTDKAVFGYTGRYDEYRFINSRLSGLMRPDAASNLASWHLSEDFSTLPTLGATFIEANLTVPLDRAIQIPSEPHFIGDFFFDIKAARPLPTYGVPGNLDRL